MNRFLFSPEIRYRLARHFLFFWLTVLIFTLVLFARSGEGGFFNTFLKVTLNALFFFSYAYITIFVIIQEFALKNKIVGALLLLILTGIGLSAIKLICSGEIFYSSISPENIERTGIFNLRYIIVNTKDMSFIVALFCIVKYAKDFLYADSMRKELEIRNKEAQDKLLQSQFDPHFLFNTINNLYALSILDPGRTNNVIARIKRVLQYIVDDSQKKLVKVPDEMELLENYIQLEKLRYGKRLKVKTEIKGDFRNDKMPPMVFFVLVENCFVHGSSHDAGNPWISIQLAKDNEYLFFRAENSKPLSGGQNTNNNRGLSLPNLEKRLKLLYNNEYHLKVRDQENLFFVELKMKKIT